MGLDLSALWPFLEGTALVLVTSGLTWTWVLHAQVVGGQGGTHYQHEHGTGSIPPCPHLWNYPPAHRHPRVQPLTGMAPRYPGVGAGGGQAVLCPAW